ncbi:MAG: tRNA epoxyqueuosine(34) reductase QueG, partial [Bacteroidales bacterium]|nr:tRNA epoxyqueuosine(34) reductase QueG [Bacteroidales bacterium]
MPDSKNKISKLIKDTAHRIGFDACGIVTTGRLEAESRYFREWLQQGYHAGMSYMNRNVDKRLDPSLLNEWARSLIIMTHNYYPADNSLSEGKYKIARYAYGMDYHDILKDKLGLVVDAIEDEIGAITARVFVDSAPVMEKAWASKAGLGWIGKNSCLIKREKGSFFFLSAIITDLELSYDEASVKDHCGNCTKCMDACPNGAIVAPGVIDSNKCISYLTIEHKGNFDPENRSMLHGWIFGCDICQEVCPFNRFSSPHDEPSFLARRELLEMTEADWKKLSEKQFLALFSGTAVERTG